MKPAIKFSVQAIENAVLLTADGKTYAFGSGMELGEKLFELAMNAVDDPNLVPAGATFDVYVMGVRAEDAIRAIKSMRTVAQENKACEKFFGLSPAKDCIDEARASGRKLIASDVSKEVVDNIRRSWISVGYLDGSYIKDVPYSA